MAFWDAISAVEVRRDSGLSATQVREQNDVTMTAYIQGRIVENARLVRRKINDAAGRFTFGVDGFSASDLAGLFPGKVEGDEHLIEGEDILSLAREAVRFRCLADLEGKNKSTGGDQSGNTSNSARTYKADATERETAILDSLKNALGETTSDDKPRVRRRPSQSTRLRSRY
jgi:hypothetical protein